MRYIVLLRGVNVAGKHKLPMAEFRTHLEHAGFASVKSYIQSGNIGLDTEGNAEKIKLKIEEILLNTYGYKVPVLVLLQSSLKVLLEVNPFLDQDPKFLHFTLLHDFPSSKSLDEFNGIRIEGEFASCIESCVHLYLPNGYGRAKLVNGFIERKLKVSATTRNYKTMLKLLDL